MHGAGELLDFVMYHEMLHKKHKFSISGVKSRYHTKEFKEDEKKFGDVKLIEKKLTIFLRKHKRKLSWF